MEDLLVVEHFDRVKGWGFRVSERRVCRLYSISIYIVISIVLFRYGTCPFDKEEEEKAEEEEEGLYLRLKHARVVGTADCVISIGNPDKAGPLWPRFRS